MPHEFRREHQDWTHSVTRVQIHQIFYDEKTRAELDHGFIPLDNLANERPDWREYWPIRRYFLDSDLDEESFYGFLSPAFQTKTGATAVEVHRFMDDAVRSNVDVAIFSPFLDLQAMFLNVFEQGDYFHPGLLGTTQEFLNEIGLRVEVKELVMDWRNSVFCNYFAAKPRFWAKWLALTESLFQIAERPSNRLYDPLNSEASMRGGGVLLKVFIMERLASFLLATNSDLVSKSYNVPAPSLTPDFINFQQEWIVCDALKFAFLEKKQAIYKACFQRVQQNVFAQILELRRQSSQNAPRAAVR